MEPANDSFNSNYRNEASFNDFNLDPGSLPLFPNHRPSFPFIKLQRYTKKSIEDFVSQTGKTNIGFFLGAKATPSANS